MNGELEQTQLISQSLGMRLRQLRIKKNESQIIFAQRLGISRQTYGKMENGHLSIPIGLWISASLLLNIQDEWRQIFQDERNLFEQVEQQNKLPQRLGRSKK